MLPLITRIRDVYVDASTGRTRVVMDATTGKRGRPRVTSFVVDAEALLVLNRVDEQQTADSVKRRRSRFLSAVALYYANRNTGTSVTQHCVSAILCAFAAADDLHVAFLDVLESMEFCVDLVRKLRAGKIVGAVSTNLVHVSSDGADDGNEGNENGVDHEEAQVTAAAEPMMLAGDAVDDLADAAAAELAE